MNREFDTPWKEFLDFFLQDSVEFFTPNRAELIDWSRGVTPFPLDTNPPQREAETGETSSDRLYQVYLKTGEDNKKLIHWEVQSQYEAVFAERMFNYFLRHRDRWGQDPWSFAILGDDRPWWRVNECRRCDAEQYVHYLWPMAKLWDWRGREAELAALPGPVPSAIDAHLASLTTRDDERLAAKIRILDRLFGSSFDQAAATKLFRVIDWFLELPPEQTQSYEDWLAEQRRSRTMPYVTNWEKLVTEKARNETRIETRIETRLETLVKILGNVLPLRFGEEGQTLFEEIKTSTDADRLEQIITKAVASRDFAELKQMLGQ